MIGTSLSKLLQVRYPIIQAPIGSAATAEFAAAVSNCGGLGTLALSWKSREDCAMLIQQVRAMTGKPFAVNLLLDFDQSERVKICLEEKVPIVIFSWGDGSVYLQRLKTAGIQVGQTVSGSKEAIYYQLQGFDFLIAQGWEAGGHALGKVTTMLLVPSLAEKVTIPFAAAGGIATGKGILAALALGADGVSIGTRFLMAEEVDTHDEFQKLIASADESDTVYSERLFNVGWDNAPHRILRNSTVKENFDYSGRSERPGKDEIIAYRADYSPIQRYSDVFPLKGMIGDVEAMALYAGQSAGLVSVVQPVSEIMDELINGLENEYENLTALFNQ